MKKIISHAAVAIALLLSIGIKFAFAQTDQVDFNTFIQETQKRSDKSGEITFVWWVPEEYWRISFAQNPGTSPAQSEEIIKLFRPYTIIAVVDGAVGRYGNISYKSEASIRGSLSVIDGQGNSYFPLHREEINADARSLLDTMKPVLSNALGPIGQNMHFFIFPARGKDGQSIADAHRQGRLLVKLGQREFRWRLPLSSLLPPKICPTCGEKVSGAYKFCPWDGTRLE